MKLGIMSDLHLEFQDWDFTPDPEMFYICAGDIHSNNYARKRFLDKFGENIFYVKGNHDFYNGLFRDQEKAEYIYKGLKISGTTLWTDLTNGVDWDIYKTTLADYRYIFDMTKEMYFAAHEMQKQFLLNSEADIIVSHHCPSYQSVHRKYAGNPMNVCFTTELADQILNMRKPPKLWIHGHTHEEFDYMIGDTRVICHPRGYPNEHAWYNDYTPKIVEL
jgi:predicted phosphodiesterase